MSSGDFLSVKDFGARGDGVAIDTAALNRAFASEGRTIYVPRGRYVIDRNLATPRCGGIVGDGDGNSLIVARGGVTKALPLDDSCVALRGFQVVGNGTANATGIVFGDSRSGAFMVENVRVRGFTGTNSVGIHCKSALKSIFTKVTVERNTTNLLVHGPGAFPTTLVFNLLVCNNAGRVGVMVVTSDSLVFNEAVFDSNHAEALRVQPMRGGSATDVVLHNPRFEDNNAGPQDYAVVVDGSAGGQCTARVKFRGGYWQASSRGVRAIRLTGSGTAAFLLDSVQVPDQEATILIDDNAHGLIVNWPTNVPMARCVRDLTKTELPHF